MAKAAKKSTTGFEPFEGIDVSSAGIELPGAGGGFHDALRVQPREIPLHEEVFVVMRLRCVKIRFDPQKAKEDDAEETLQRVHVMKVQEVAFVGHDDVAQPLHEQRERIEAQKIADEEAQGITRLPFSDAAKLPDDDGASFGEDE